MAGQSRKKEGNFGPHISSRLAAGIIADASFDTVEAFFGNDGNHDQASSGVRPPPPKNRIQKKSAQQNSSQIRTKISLFRIGVHGCAAKRSAYPLLRTRKNRHHNERNTSQNDAWNALLRRSSADEIQNRFISDIRSQSKKAEADNPEAEPFLMLAALRLRIN